MVFQKPQDATHIRRRWWHPTILNVVHHTLIQAGRHLSTAVVFARPHCGWEGEKALHRPLRQTTRFLSWRRKWSLWSTYITNRSPFHVGTRLDVGGEMNNNSRSVSSGHCKLLSSLSIPDLNLQKTKVIFFLPVSFSFRPCAGVCLHLSLCPSLLCAAVSCNRCAKKFLFWETRSSSLWTLCIVDSYTLMQLSSLRNQQNGAFNKEVIDRFVMSIKHYAVRIINSRLRSD